MTANEVTRSDADLIRGTLGSQQAFEQLVERYFGMVFSIALARVGQREAAEEIAQETFLRAYLNLKTLRDPQHLSSWLGSIARNLAENWRVRKQVRSKLVAMVPLDALEVELPDTRITGAREQVAARQESDLVQSAVAKLPSDQRELVLLHFLEGLTKSEIARRVGVYPSSVGRQLEKALNQLRLDLGPKLEPAFVREAVGPSTRSARRAGLLGAGIALLPKASRAALESAAAESFGPAAPPVHTFVHHIARTLTSGGKGMFVIKTLVVVGVIGGVAGGVLTKSHEGTEAKAQGDRTKSTAVQQSQLPSNNAGKAVADTAQNPQQLKDASREANPSVAEPEKTSDGTAALPNGQQSHPAIDSPHAELNAGKIIAQAGAPSVPRVQAAPSGGVPGAPRVSGTSMSVSAITPNIMEAGMRSKVSRAKADMRSMATGIEAYFVDNNRYPPCDTKGLIRKPAAGEMGVPSFAGPQLTTPIAYITSFFQDPFGQQGQPFAYLVKEDQKDPASAGWMLVSPGPNGNFEMDWNLYDITKAQPSPELLLRFYDPTNGTISGGDIVRVKQ